MRKNEPALRKYLEFACKNSARVSRATRYRPGRSSGRAHDDGPAHGSGSTHGVAEPRLNRVICLGGRGRWVYADPIIGTRRSTKRPSGADGRETVALPPAAREAPCPSHRNCYHRNCSMRRSLGAARLLAAHLPQMPFRRRIARCCCACSDRGLSALAIRIGWMGCPPIRRRERTRLPCRDGLDRPTPPWEMNHC
jgi:hypothetical protein